MKAYRIWLRRRLPPELLRRVNHLSHPDELLFGAERRRARLARLALRERYAGLFADLEPDEFAVFSQNGEDGILLSLLSGLESPVKRFVEIGVEEGLE